MKRAFFNKENFFKYVNKKYYEKLRDASEKEAYKIKGEIWVNFDPEEIIAIKTNKGNYINPHNVHPKLTDDIKTLQGPVISPKEYKKILKKKKPEFYYLNVPFIESNIKRILIFYEPALILTVKTLILDNGEEIKIKGENIMDYEPVNYIPNNAPFTTCETFIIFDGDKMRFGAKHWSCRCFNNNGIETDCSFKQTYRGMWIDYYKEKEVPYKYLFLKNI